MEEEIIGLLTASPAVTIHVGAKVRPGRAAQEDKPPFLVVQRISGVRDHTFQGRSGYVESRLQIDAYAATYAGAKLLARSVVQTLSLHRSAAVQGAFCDGERDLPADDAGGVKTLFRVSLDFNIHHLET